MLVFFLCFTKQTMLVQVFCVLLVSYRWSPASNIGRFATAVTSIPSLWFLRYLSKCRFSKLLLHFHCSHIHLLCFSKPELHNVWGLPLTELPGGQIMVMKLFPNQVIPRYWISGVKTKIFLLSSWILGGWVCSWDEDFQHFALYLRAFSPTKPHPIHSF